MLREDWMHEVANLAQCAAASILTDPQPYRAARALLARAPLPVTRLEEIILYGLLFEAAVGGPAGTSAVIRTKARRGLRRLLPRIPRDERDAAARVVRVARTIIDEHARRLNVVALARSEGLHEVTLRRLFRARYGVSPREFQTRIRICRAIHLFADVTPDILAVARSVGYGSEKNFYRAVRKVTGLTPARLREANWSCRWDSCSRLYESARASAVCSVQRAATERKR